MSSTPTDTHPATSEPIDPPSDLGEPPEFETPPELETPPDVGEPSDLDPPSDLETPSELDPTSDIDPRMSARRTEVTRQQGLRRRRLGAILLTAAAALTAGWAILHSPLFTARAVTVVGATHETPAEVVAAAGLAGHPPLMDVNTGAAALGIDRLPWVRAASVTVHWPDGVRIVISERAPQMAMSVSGGRWAELSAGGRVLAVVAAQPLGLVVVVGPQPPGPPGSVVGGPDQVGLRIASTLPPSFRAQVTEVHIEPGGWVQLDMTTPIVVDIGSASQLRAKYEDVSAILAGATLHVGDIVDVSVPDAPSVTRG